MKNLLISIIGILLIILTAFAVFSGIPLGKMRIYSVKDIKAVNAELDERIEQANTKINQEYAQRVSTIGTSVNNLREIKEKYQNAINSLGLNSSLGLSQIEKYKIEYLWIKLGLYGKKRNVMGTLTITETSIDDTYNIQFTLVGSYRGITDFLYDIENDDELNYSITNFKIEPTSNTTTSTTNNTTTTANTDRLQATFQVENVIIKLD